MDIKNNNLAKVFINDFPLPEPIVEIGSFLVPGQEKMGDLRPYVKGKEFIGCDMRPGLGVDRIENVEKLTFADNSVGTVIILNTLEHVANCYQAMEEIFRVLKEGGMVLMSSVMDFNIHDYPSDYWRFTPEAFKYLLKKFSIKMVGYDGDPLKPRMVFAIGVKNSSADYKLEFDKFTEDYISANRNLVSWIWYYIFSNLLTLRFFLRSLIGRAAAIKTFYYKE